MSVGPVCQTALLNRLECVDPDYRSKYQSPEKNEESTQKETLISIMEIEIKKTAHGQKDAVHKALWSPPETHKCPD